MKKTFSKTLLAVIFFCIFALSSKAYAEKIRVGVAEFVGGHSNSSTAMTETFVKILAGLSNNLEAVSSKSFQLLNTKANENYIAAGKYEHCEYLVLGAVTQNTTNVSHSYEDKGFLVPIKTPKTTTETQIATLEVRLIEVSTGKIILSLSGTGKSSYSYSAQKARSIKEMSGNDENNRYNALSSAASMAAEKICAYLTGEYPKVSFLQSVTQSKKKSKSKKSKDSVLGTINIDRGTLSGIHEKSFFKIFFEGEEVFDFNGTSLGREKFNIAVAEVKNTKTDYCIADVVGGIFTNIKIGDKAEQITDEEAKKIIKNNNFSKFRLSEFLN